MWAMVVDEDSVNAEAVSLLLRHQGFRVRVAHSIDVALGIFRKLRIDLVLSEISFQEKSVLDLYEARKQQVSQQNPPAFVFMGAPQGAENADILSKIGGNLFFEKPLMGEAVMTAIRQMIMTQKLFIKEHTLLLLVTELEAADVISMLDDFHAVLESLSKAVESRASKSVLRAGFVDAQSYAEMIGTDDLKELFQQYASAQGVDYIQLKEVFQTIERQILRTKENLLGIHKDVSDLEGGEAEGEGEEEGNEEDIFVAHMARILRNAEGGDIDSQYELAMLYLAGSPEYRSVEEGNKWLHEAARNRHPQAIFQSAFFDLFPGSLSISKLRAALSAMGYGQSEESEFWKRSILVAITSLEEMMGTGQSEAFSIDAHLQHALHTPEEKYAVFILNQAFEGNVDCQYWIGKLYESGQILTPLLPVAAYWLEKASTGGHVEATYRLGLLYQQGLTRYSKENERAFECFKYSAEQGHLYSQFCLAKLYHNGVGTEVNLGQARRWYETAAQQGHAQAQYWLGTIFEETNSTQTDLRDALKWYIISLESGSNLSLNQIPIIQKKMAPHEVEMARAAAQRYIQIQNSKKQEALKQEEAAVSPEIRV